MTPQEKALYHQIHPLKLSTDIAAEFVSCYLFWKRKPVAGLTAMFVPPVVASALIMHTADLERYERSAFGKYIRVHMTPRAIALRVFGTIITHIGAWYRRPLLIPLGLLVVLLGWCLGILRLQEPGDLKTSKQ
jgi:hypothetical protein